MSCNRRTPGARAVAGEEHEQRVAAELQGFAIERARQVDERRDDAAEGVDELLDFGLAASGETLGQRREARDVDEHQAGVRLPPGSRPVLGHHAR